AISIGCIAAALLAIIVDQMIYMTELAISKRKSMYAIPVIIGFLLVITFSVYTFVSKSDKNQFVVDIGSKPFTEQYILAEYLDETVSELEFQTELHSGMGTMILFEALKNSEIDLYVDYSGTIWTNVLKREDIPSKEQILSEMTEYLDKEFGIKTLGKVGFENTYALVVKKNFADSLRIESISDLQKFAPNLSIGSDYEFFTRPEWQSIEEKYELTFKDEITLDPTLMYQAIENDEVEVISAYSTDGRIAAFNLFALNDPFQALPPYDAVILISPELAKEEAIVNKLKKLINSIDNKKKCKMLTKL
ncbi:MAG: ABC transporter permease, partial [Calditrichaeota bacterium]